MFSLLIAGCTKESITLYKAYIKNETNHQIKVTPYFGGSVYNDKIIILNAGDSVIIADGYDRGIVNHGGFTPKYFAGCDSLSVIFDNLYPVSHYVITPVSLYPRHYLYASLRNVANYLGWDYNANDISQHKREAFYLYRFVEQDYLDAK